MARNCKIVNASLRGAESGHAGCPSWAVLPAVEWDEHLGSAGLDTGRCCSFALSMASWRLWLSLGAEGSPGTGWVMGVGAGQEQSQGRKRHFSLGWCSWRRPWPRGGVARLAPAPAPAPALGCHRDPGGGGQVGTWQYFQGWAGGSVWAPRTARSSGWASAELPGCLGGGEDRQDKEVRTQGHATQFSGFPLPASQAAVL